MLKGTMTIELTDVHSGKTEKVLEHNMVTNALSKIFKPLGAAKDPSLLLKDFAPYYQKLLGGLLLFDRNIEENPENFYPPAEARLIGCAAYNTQNNTTNTLRGGYNQVESELNLTDRYMKFVYDFTTSQANGTIGCVCLTHQKGGFTSYGGATVYDGNYPLALRIDDGSLQYVYPNYTGGNTGDKYTGVTVGKTECLFLIDRETDMAYYFRIDSANSLTIVRRRAYLKSVSILTSPYNTKELVDETVIPDLSIIVGASSNYVSYNFDHGTNSLYICSTSSSYKDPNGTFNITKIAFGNWAVTECTMTNTTDVRLSTSGTRFAFCHNGFVYLKTYNSPYDVYKFEIGNSANVEKMSFGGTINTVTGVPQLAINGRIYYENYASSSSYGHCIVNESTNEILRLENAYTLGSSKYVYTHTPVLNEPMLWYSSCGSYTTSGFFILANYLATINNLPEPVTKTVDKTMKVTYTIQEQ